MLPFLHMLVLDIGFLFAFFTAYFLPCSLPYVSFFFSPHLSSLLSSFYLLSSLLSPSVRVASAVELCISAYLPAIVDSCGSDCAYKLANVSLTQLFHHNLISQRLVLYLLYHITVILDKLACHSTKECNRRLKCFFSMFRPSYLIEAYSSPGKYCLVCVFGCST